MKVLLLLCLFALPYPGKSQDFLERFRYRKQTEFFDFRYREDSLQKIPEIARFSDAFINLLNRDFFKADFDYRRVPWTCIFHRIREKIYQHLA